MVPILLGSRPRPSRALRFALVGGSVFACGLLLLTLLVSVLDVPPVTAGLICTAASLQVNFLLSRRVTWGDRTGDLRAQWLRFHGARLGTVLANQAFYSALVIAGVPFVLSALVTTALAALLNYGTADRFVFGTSR